MRFNPASLNSRKNRQQLIENNQQENQMLETVENSNQEKTYYQCPIDGFVHDGKEVIGVTQTGLSRIFGIPESTVRHRLSTDRKKNLTLLANSSDLQANSEKFSTFQPLSIVLKHTVGGTSTRSQLYTIPQILQLATLWRLDDYLIKIATTGIKVQLTIESGFVEPVEQPKHVVNFGNVSVDMCQMDGEKSTEFLLNQGFANLKLKLGLKSYPGLAEIVYHLEEAGSSNQPLLTGTTDEDWFSVDDWLIEVDSRNFLTRKEINTIYKRAAANYRAATRKNPKRGKSRFSGKPTNLYQKAHFFLLDQAYQSLTY